MPRTMATRAQSARRVLADDMWLTLTARREWSNGALFTSSARVQREGAGPFPAHTGAKPKQEPDQSGIRNISLPAMVAIAANVLRLTLC
jgi:hypothetical protein